MASVPSLEGRCLTPKLLRIQQPGASICGSGAGRAERMLRKSLSLRPTPTRTTTSILAYYMRHDYGSAARCTSRPSSERDRRPAVGRAADSYDGSGRTAEALARRSARAVLTDQQVRRSRRGANSVEATLYWSAVASTRERGRKSPGHWAARDGQVLFRAAIVPTAGRRDEALRALESALRQGFR